MRDRRWLFGVFVACLVIEGLLAAPRPSTAHPLGNFSINQYTEIRIEPHAIALQYLIDMAEIPTFQELQAAHLVPEAGHPSLHGYLARQAERLKAGLRLEVDGRGLHLQGESLAVSFPPGAGGLPTLTLGMRYRAALDETVSAQHHELRYWDANFPGRAGWKEIIAVAAQGVALTSSSVPTHDRSGRLTDYPTDVLNSPPQDLEARVRFSREGTSPAMATAGPPGVRSPAVQLEGRSTQTRATDPPTTERSSTASLTPEAAAGSAEQVMPPTEPWAEARLRPEPALRPPTGPPTPRDAFTELVATRQLGVGVVLIAMAVAAGLGAFHALEPGHGKTVVAAYLVGARGTAWHALVLGLLVTGAHTAGVYLLGLVTLYASRYVVPERLYPWLGVSSGLLIAGVGVSLLRRQYRGETHQHAHAHPHDHGHAPHHDRGCVHPHAPEQPAPHLAGEPSHVHGARLETHHQDTTATVSRRQLVALGVMGGIVPCPAALVVLLSAVSFHRVGFGLLLIVAFSVGLAAVLIGVGLLMVYARRVMSRVHGEGAWITRWLPLTSAAVITLFGIVIAVQALASAGVLPGRL